MILKNFNENNLEITKFDIYYIKKTTIKLSYQKVIAHRL